MSSEHTETVSTLPAPLPGPDHHCIVPDGNYRAIYIAAEGFHYRGKGPRIALWFRMDCGNMIAGYYIVERIRKRGDRIRGRARDPEFIVGWKSRLVRDLAVLYPKQYSPRQLPTCVPHISRPLRIVTATVKRDGDGADRPECLWSSKVDRIAGWAPNRELDIYPDWNVD